MRQAFRRLTATPDINELSTEKVMEIVTYKITKLDRRVV